MANKTMGMLAEKIRIPLEELEQALNFQWDKPEITRGEARHEFLRVTIGSEQELFWFTKWLELCATTEEAMDAYDTAPSGGVLEKIALQKVWELFQQEP